MKISIIVAVDENNGIGANNQLLWHLPADLKFFKETTTAHTIIMGRKTFDSIGKPLPKRRSLVISRDQDLKIAGAETFTTIADALAVCKIESEVFIIGGAEIYNLALSFSDRIYLTKVHHEFKADVFFPEISINEWKETKRVFHPKDDKNSFDFSFLILDRI